MKKKSPFLLGAHMSISGGLHKAIEQGSSIGCTTIQLFTKSNRQWAAKKLLLEDIELFKQARQKLRISPIIAHACYLINIGSIDVLIEEKSVQALSIELQRCSDLGIEYLVLHPGSRTTVSEQECLDKIVKNLDDILSRDPDGETMILLETMAGQGSVVGSTFEHLEYILKNSKYKKRLGVCVDTCHIFAAGYDIRDLQSYETTWKKFDEVVGIENIKVIHINDSKRELSCNVDRHENIGEGKIGLYAFELLMNDARFQLIPKILETPKDSLEEDEKNLKVLLSLLK